MAEPTFDDRKLSFGEAAKQYDRFRPSYPRDAIEWIFSGANRDVRDVADVGAGTGALTKVLLESGKHVTCFEPDKGMLEHLLHNFPSVDGRICKAENLESENCAFDALTVGQAFHWFDGDVATKEFRRVLRPGGVVGLLWNIRDEREDWVAQLRTFIDGPDSKRGDDDDELNRLAEVLPGVEQQYFANSRTMTPRDVVGLVGTFSYVRLHEDRERILTEVTGLLANHPDTRNRNVIAVPYLTLVYRCAFA